MQIVRRADFIVTLSLATFLSGATAIFMQRILGLAWFGLVVGVIVLIFGLRRSFFRWRATRERLPSKALGWLTTHVPLYPSLADKHRLRFERDVQIAMSELRFEGVAGAEVTNELKLAVAAGAALLLHGRPDWDLPRGHTILFYPRTFDEGYDIDTLGRFEGLINSQGPILLSVPAVIYGWQHEDGLNVVLHELAHLLDFQGAGHDGLPALLSTSSADAWRLLVREEIRKVKEGRSVLRPYAATNSAELFAVAVELFFEQPLRLKEGQPQLFSALAALFNLDPTPRTAKVEEDSSALLRAHVE